MAGTPNTRPLLVYLQRLWHSLSRRLHADHKRLGGVLIEADTRHNPQGRWSARVEITYRFGPPAGPDQGQEFAGGVQNSRMRRGVQPQL
jgi:hypothetical protein